MAMCKPCEDGNCIDCLTPSCPHGHRGSGRRPLTNAERVDYALGRIASTTLPEQPKTGRIEYVIPAPSTNGTAP